MFYNGTRVDGGERCGTRLDGKSEVLLKDQDVDGQHRTMIERIKREQTSRVKIAEALSFRLICLTVLKRRYCEIWQVSVRYYNCE